MEDSSRYKDDRHTEKGDGRKTLLNKFGSTVATSFYTEKGSDLLYGEDPVEKHKKRVLKKTISLVPSLDKEVRNNLILALQRGPNRTNEELKGKQLELAEEIQEKMLSEGRKFMNTESAEQLKVLLHRVIIERDSAYDTILEILKLYLVSATEKEFVDQIDEELRIGISLDEEIKSISQSVAQEKEKKRNMKPISENVETQLRQIKTYENKIEKANQKLNEKMTKSAEIRQRIDKIRKENMAFEQIRDELEKDLKMKQEKVENTIKNAGYAYIKRNEAERELKDLKEKAVNSKLEFEAEVERIREDIQEMEKFKEFIDGKTKEKRELEILTETIARNKKRIEERERANAMMEIEYSLSSKKEEEIKKAFGRLMEETGIKKPEYLLGVFNNLYEKTQNMEKFIKELTSEIDGLVNQISFTKQQLQNYNEKGASNDNRKREEKTDLIKRLELEYKKKELYKAHYEKLIEALSAFKDMIQKVFVAIGADQEMLERIKNSALTEDNMIEFIGILEKKGISLVGEYSYLLAEQIKFERGDFGLNMNLIEDINNLNNIVAYENANVLLTKANAQLPPKDFPDEMLTAIDSQNDKDTALKETVLSSEQFQQMALSILQSPNRHKVLSPLPRNATGTGTGIKVIKATKALTIIKNNKNK